MDPLQRFAAYAADFEKTFRDDDWTRLEGYFAEDAVYTVEGVPFACEVRGRDAIFRAIRRSIDGFDRRFDSREIEADGPPEVEGSRVTFAGRVRYQKRGLEPLAMELAETAELDAEGRIVRLRDVYAPGQEAALAWVSKHAADFDPSYV